MVKRRKRSIDIAEDTKSSKSIKLNTLDDKSEDTIISFMSSLSLSEKSHLPYKPNIKKRTLPEKWYKMQTDSESDESEIESDESDESEIESNESEIPDEFERIESDESEIPDEFERIESDDSEITEVSEDELDFSGNNKSDLDSLFNYIEDIQKETSSNENDSLSSEDIDDEYYLSNEESANYNMDISDNDSISTKFSKLDLR